MDARHSIGRRYALLEMGTPKKQKPSLTISTKSHIWRVPATSPERQSAHVRYTAGCKCCGGGVAYVGLTVDGKVRLRAGMPP